MKAIKYIIDYCVALTTVTIGMVLVGVFLFVGSAAAENTSLEIRPKGKDIFLPLETRETRAGKFEFRGGYPTKETVREIYKEIDFQRASQAYIWAIPAATMEYVNQNYLNLSGGVPGKLIYTDGWDDVFYAGLTTNLTTPYYWFMGDLSKTGPLVLEDPLGKVAGYINDIWQRHVTDLGRPGVFKGKGGKHLVVGPGQDVPAGAEKKYHIVRSKTFVFWLLLRDLYPNFEEGRRAIETFNSYPYSERHNVKPVKIEPQGGRYMAWAVPHGNGLRYWEMVSNVINREPIEERDRFFTAMLMPLGIEKGKPFNPTAEQREILEEAAYVGRAMTATIDFAKRNGMGFYAEGSNHVLTQVSNFEQKGEYHEHLDERAAVFNECLTTSKGMTSTTPGIGSNYLSGYTDSDGDWLHGANQYVLSVPANVPAKNFWSVTAYRNAHAGLIDNKWKIGDRSSRHDLHFNKDGSVDIYFGPKPPKDKNKRKNWLPTNPNEGWFTWFRFYGPLQPHFDRTWVLPSYKKTKFEELRS